MARMLGMLLLAASVLGCDAGKSTYPTARLEGSVTVDDQPIPEGNLQFVRQDGGQAVVTAAAIVDGRYVAESVPRGRLRVLLSATKATGKMIKEYNTPRPEVINLIPAKYRMTGIPIEVTGDNANLNFALRSR
jgi:hypothetical protein